MEKLSEFKKIIISQVNYKGTCLVINPPFEIEIKQKQDKKHFVAENEEYNINVIAETEEKLLEELQEDIFVLWKEYICEKDEVLFEDALKLKRKLYPKIRLVQMSNKQKDFFEKINILKTKFQAILKEADNLIEDLKTKNLLKSKRYGNCDTAWTLVAEKELPQELPYFTSWNQEYEITDPDVFENTIAIFDECETYIPKIEKLFFAKKVAENFYKKIGKKND
jgi:RNAse (barnase) inhibitor barstar